MTLVFKQLSTIIVSYFVIWQVLIISFTAQLNVIPIMLFFAFLTFVFQHTLILTLIPTLVFINVPYLGWLIA